MSRKILNNELGRKNIQEFKDSVKVPLIIVLDDIRSLNNIGSVFRTADAFLIEKIYLCGITATPPNKEIHKTALGATETVDWEYVEDIQTLLEDLTAQGIQIWSVEQVQGATMLNDFEVIQNQRYALIFGNEVKGVSEKAIKLSKGYIEIPQLGTKHSLNISVSVGVVIWDLVSKLKIFLNR
ncbi:MAG: RNA methyltransferase [Bacteroidota bacterium]|nr:RNA methyltransferase [Bacteroidota bacterium]